MNILELEQMIVENEQQVRQALAQDQTIIASDLMLARAALKDSLIYELKKSLGLVKERRSKDRTRKAA